MDSTLEAIRSVQLAVITPINLLGNLAVCIVVSRTPSMRTHMNYLLVNLAISDMLVAIFMTLDQIFLHGVLEHPTGFQGDMMCKFLTGKLFSWVGSVASVFTMTAVGLERYYAIVHPLSHRGRISKKIFWRLFAFILCWVFAICFNIPLILVRIYNTERASTGYLCRSNWPSRALAVTYNIAWLLLIGIIPIGIMGYLYSSIVRALWFSGGHQIEAAQQVRLRARKRVTKMLIIITIIYAICWLPNLLINVINYYYTGNPATKSYVYLITEVLVLINSSINPFVYTIQSQQFRNGVKALLCCRLCRKRVHAANAEQSAEGEGSPTTFTLEKYQTRKNVYIDNGQQV